MSDITACCPSSTTSMAELGIAAGIAGLVSLTIQVFGISYKYVHEVRNASSSARQFLSELKNLKDVLVQIEKTAKAKHQEDLFGDDGSCLLSMKDSNEYRNILEEVRDKLAQRQSESSLRKNFKALTWPFSEKETLALAESFHRHLGIYNVALAADSRYANCTADIERLLLSICKQDFGNAYFD